MRFGQLDIQYWYKFIELVAFTACNIPMPGAVQVLAIFVWTMNSELGISTDRSSLLIFTKEGIGYNKKGAVK
jgi:hypothetical protein